MVYKGAIVTREARQQRSKEANACYNKLFKFILGNTFMKSLKLPIGYDEFGQVVESRLSYIDKSLFIEEVLDDSCQVIAIMRPRRFGKTFNLSLLHYFLAKEVLGKPTEGMFNDLKIFQCGEEYMQHQGKYPVISISFKDVKHTNFEHAYSKLYELMVYIYSQHSYLETSQKLSKVQKEFYAILVERRADQSQLENSLKVLMECLYAHHGIKPWLLIDEYDTPIQAAYVNKHYDKMIGLMRGMFGATLKNNPYLNKAVITGILRVAKESLFSGLNNLRVYSVLNDKYSEYFGFTESEVDNILQQSGLSDQSAAIKEWYNGYQIGKTTVYNPWSIVNCVVDGTIKPYWINTSDNQLIKDLLERSPLDFKVCFERLMRGESTEKLIDETMLFDDLSKNIGAVWDLLLMSGYLTSISWENTWNGTLCQLRVPNQEVNNLYRQIIGLWLSNKYGLEWYSRFTASLLSCRMDEFNKYLESVLEQIVSFHDLAQEPEAFFHGLLLGFIASLQDTHEIKSNRETGLGRHDIMLIPKDISQFGIVIELKAKQQKDTLSLEVLADKALQQIDEKKYTIEFKQRGIINVIKIGIAFQGKAFILRYIKE